MDKVEGYLNLRKDNKKYYTSYKNSHFHYHYEKAKENGISISISKTRN